MKSNPAQNKKTAIQPTRAENYPEWYQQIIRAADLAEVSPVRGCMIIKPWGYALWENMHQILDAEFKATGHKNAYFPLLIPLSFMQKEAEHIEGFAKECAVVTHHRLAKDDEGKLVPAGLLEEPYIIRPTSETIIGDAFSRWIQSYRDLPLLINQWANVMRWEMRTRLFLRTSEFLWQEGHTAHATEDEAMREARQMLAIYARFAEEVLAMPVITGEKTASERFPGAENTYCIEAMMQDKKALQAGTSHFLGQHFSKSFDIKFLNTEGNQEFAWTTSWGVSTRLIGGLIMTHSDDDGLVLPPRIAPVHVVLMPLVRGTEDDASILVYCQDIANQLRAMHYHDRQLQVEVDTRAIGGGEKAWGWVKKGVPIRVEIGKKELAEKNVFIGRRDLPYHARTTESCDNFLLNVTKLLDEIQQSLFQRAQHFQQEHTREIDSEAAFRQYFSDADHSGFARVYWKGNEAIENELKKSFNITIRCIPFNQHGPGKCIFTKEDGAVEVIFARAY